MLFGGALPSWADGEATVEATIETKDAADCAAYPGSENWCDPDHGDYDCGEIPNSVKPVPVPGDDPFGLDGNNDGQGCEADAPPGGDAGGGPSEEPPAEEPPAEEPPAEEPPAEEPPAEDPGPCAHYADSAAWCSDTHGDYDCPDIDDAYKPIELFDAELDPFHLDRDSDALGCEIGEDDDGGSDDGAGGTADDGAGEDDGGAAGAGVGGDGEELPNTGSGDLGALWLAALAFLAAGALLVIRRTAAQR
ncbi:LPXTG cell wall anchor domain-containing protein [Jiangella rhizosphaerae]|uniref:LPXTG cell wall anchor domain-containing protein n=1 Tax=Jiangella rhizosphaerae TaxID=2293569 RepID=A0A418KHC4_9ACTN|nr:LPXTG cell wall anchor domain-containing protein [Jiangella rhizosphaerae]